MKETIYFLPIWKIKVDFLFTITSVFRNKANGMRDDHLTNEIVNQVLNFSQSNELLCSQMIVIGSHF